MNGNGKFIVFEGIDASGKNTQFKLLRDRLKSLKIKMLTADFPRYYSSPWGKTVGRFLTGKFGGLDEVDPYLAVYLYMVDQYTWSRDIGKPWLEKGDWIISNRYFTSNVHQIAKLKTRARKKYRDWLWPAGYKDLGIVRPDLVIFVDTPPEVCKKLNLEKEKRDYLRGRKQDIAEKNWRHQASAYREYGWHVKNYNWWVSVPGIQDVEKDYSKVIHKEVYKIITKKFKLPSLEGWGKSLR